MNRPITSNRFDTEEGTEISVQVPQIHADSLLEALYPVHPMTYGSYDKVSFQSQPGTQRFRTLPGSVNTPTEHVVEVNCVELVFFIPTVQEISPVLEAIYAQHPYEEPVVILRPCLRTRHKAGQDEANPNKFWNRPTEDWVPAAHRPK